ncbi:ATP-binding protein [Kribbella sp. CWNU-51]
MRQALSHPVTEETTGLDLVALQFAVAVGERLPADQPPTIGHPIEVRLYAEEPAEDWQPQTGRLHRFGIGDDRLWGNKLAPGDENFPHSSSGPRLRVEAGGLTGRRFGYRVGGGTWPHDRSGRVSGLVRRSGLAVVAVRSETTTFIRGAGVRRFRRG